ncbi:hypothetical protein LCGC14_0551820 [marine sediment metagenome]|uniref:Uncharacterized protein n=1 Tax=marine sediment metagenome TaxID=412755 RepID=A0A0F9RPM1_9ZZZZ
MALNPRIANVIAILGLDALLDGLDAGAGAATIDGRSGAQPADPDTTITGTRLFANVMTDPAFAGATDGAGKATAAASAISDDTSADATGTLGYNRIGSTTTPPTLIDDLIDGECGTSGADYNYNTLAIVSGATVSMSALTIDLSET